ncbi:MAG: hypothetical protein KatS3mg077_1739 [Candidatus Binatia bacterium]|nr:MAG: hypothetical protein KatS3mg077_1739 [Candidatus Binatia bacterium]
MTMSGSVRAESTRAGRTIAEFPSLQWFELLAQIANAERPRFEHLGYCDCVAEFCVTDTTPWPFVVQVTFEEFEVADVRVPGPEDAQRADFRIEGSLAAWRDMIESIARNHGRPDLEQTLNHLTHMGTPMRVAAQDPVRRDLYFRYAQSLQEFFNLSERIATRFAG